MALISGALVTLVGGALSDLIGRKKLIILSDFMFFFGPLILFFAGSIAQLYIGRLIIGIGMGFSVLICCVYLGEVAPTELRGSIAGMYHFAVLSGIVISYGAGIVYEGDWALMFGLGCIPSCVQFLVICFLLPESPPYLASKGYLDQAVKCTANLYSNTNNSSYKEFVESLKESSKNKSEISFKEALQELMTKYRRNFQIGVMLQVF
jgi:SP family myo-inositol transporter-like MFS transporter 13